MRIFILFTVFRYNDVLGVKIAIIALGVIYLIYFQSYLCIY